MRKIDLCLSSEGTEVILATSSDEKHPPENMIDGNAETFWTTTGMFPQEFILCFHKHVRIERLVIQSYFVKTLRIEKSTSKEPVDFEPWIERGSHRRLWKAWASLRTKPNCPPSSRDCSVLCTPWADCLYLRRPHRICFELWSLPCTPSPPRG
ncbi:intraflagellar transport protein 25 homolog isoform X1 [Suricata suricatta]|uniref:Heat shock protein family B (small) member 11 n=1 Tax=Suricata suricatta TaxID=37032 RepID=A0A673TIP4_SURSU|nr:intraflagellar transport protein 25 homolog isoform X1 [Suricata suricatta]XP_029803715.1 intraflagellar transport protein 25 homolog isoform X1 [Suricata suricatta]XP_029803716.1 intraflagellar transport protein 25 homolog isoform X1 [Suricata suricatta]